MTLIGLVTACQLVITGHLILYLAPTAERSNKIASSYHDFSPWPC